MEKDYLAIQKEKMLAVYPNRQLTLVRGEGVYLFDEAGNSYLDLLGNYGVNIIGYSHPALISVLNEQVKRLINLHSSFANDSRSEALEALAGILPPNLSKVFFSNSGTESVEAALKFALFATGRKKMVAALNDYHGKTLGALGGTTSHDDRYRQPFADITPGFDFLDFNQAGDLEKITEQTAAVILEPVQGEGGVVAGTPEFFQAVRRRCDETGTLLIIDEVQTGLGRTGKMFAFEHFGIEPDILCLGKGLAGGLPVGLTVVSEKIAAKIPQGLHTNTFGGGPLVCAGLRATLDVLQKENLVFQAAEKGRYFLNALRGIESDLVKEVRGLGLMIALELECKALPYLIALQKNKILAGPSSENVIRFLPPLIISKEEIDKGIAVLKKILI